MSAIGVRINEIKITIFKFEYKWKLINLGNSKILIMNLIFTIDR